jgi:hypothetical protein
MKLSMQDLRRIAVEVAEEEGLNYDVAGATHAEGDPVYAEIIFAHRGGAGDTGQVVIGLDRDTSEQACRDLIRAQLRRFLQPDGTGASR